MYELYNRVPSTLAEIADFMSKQIRSIGESYVNDFDTYKDSVSFVSALNDLR